MIVVLAASVPVGVSDDDGAIAGDRPSAGCLVAGQHAECNHAGGLSPAERLGRRSVVSFPDDGRSIAGNSSRKGTPAPGESAQTHLAGLGRPAKSVSTLGPSYGSSVGGYSRQLSPTISQDSESAAGRPDEFPISDDDGAVVRNTYRLPGPEAIGGAEIGNAGLLSLRRGAKSEGADEGAAKSAQPGLLTIKIHFVYIT